MIFQAIDEEKVDDMTTDEKFTTQFLAALKEYGNGLTIHTLICYISCHFERGNQGVYIAANAALALHAHFNRIAINHWEWSVIGELERTVIDDEQLAEFDARNVFEKMSDEDRTSFIRKVISRYIGAGSNDTDWLEMVELTDAR